MEWAACSESRPCGQQWVTRVEQEMRDDAENENLAEKSDPFSTGSEGENWDSGVQQHHQIRYRDELGYKK